MCMIISSLIPCSSIVSCPFVGLQLDLLLNVADLESGNFKRWSLHWLLFNNNNCRVGIFTSSLLGGLEWGLTYSMLSSYLLSYLYLYHLQQVSCALCLWPNKVLLTLLPSGLNPALVGLSLTYLISLAGLLQYAVRQSAEVESIVSLQYQWMSQGTDIEMTNYIISMILILTKLVGMKLCKSSSSNYCQRKDYAMQYCCIRLLQGN